MGLQKAFSAGFTVLTVVLAFAGTASATALTSPEGTTYTGEIVATSTNTELDGAFVSVKCGHSKTEGSIGGHGSEANAEVVLSLLTFSECNYATTVLKPGSLEVTSSNSLISNGLEFSITTSVGTCIFSTKGTSIGTLTEGKSAHWDIASAKIPRTGGNFLCGSSWTWTGSYDFTTPNDLWVD